MNLTFKTALITAVASMAIGQAQAAACVEDADCTSLALSLVKKAVKLKACGPEAQALAQSIRLKAGPSERLDALERCVAVAKVQAKLEKKALKRQERIKKALGQG
jgi:hypothetical protein